jgi:hypothetical protein
MKRTPATLSVAVPEFNLSVTTTPFGQRIDFKSINEED